MANNSQYDVVALAAALERFLANSLSRKAIDYRRSPSAGNSNPPGSHEGKLDTLFWLLSSDPEYGAIVDRPHNATDFRASLKRSAETLHRDHSLIVGLDRRIVRIHRVGWKAS